MKCYMMNHLIFYLQSGFLEQMDEMVALPTLLKMTHIKIQEENDVRILAEETREKLELQIRQVYLTQ